MLAPDVVGVSALPGEGVVGLDLLWSTYWSSSSSDVVVGVVRGLLLQLYCEVGIIATTDVAIGMGSKVTWKSKDKEIPKGHVGTVVNCDAAAERKWTVHWPNGNWLMHHNELVPVSGPAPSIIDDPLRRDRSSSIWVDAVGASKGGEPGGERSLLKRREWFCAWVPG